LNRHNHGCGDSGAFGCLVANDEFKIPFLEGEFGEFVLTHHPNQFLYLIEIHVKR